MLLPYIQTGNSWPCSWSPIAAYVLLVEWLILASTGLFLANVASAVKLWFARTNSAALILFFNLLWIFYCETDCKNTPCSHLLQLLLMAWLGLSLAWWPSCPWMRMRIVCLWGRRTSFFCAPLPRFFFSIALDIGKRRKVQDKCMPKAHHVKMGFQQINDPNPPCHQLQQPPLWPCLGSLPITQRNTPPLWLW